MTESILKHVCPESLKVFYEFDKPFVGSLSDAYAIVDADMRTHCQRTDEWLRRRLHMSYWKQWKKIGTRNDNLIRSGISNSKAWEFANTRKGTGRLPIAL